MKATGFREYDARWLLKEINLMGVQALGMGLGALIAELGVKQETSDVDQEGVFRSDKLGARDSNLLIRGSGPGRGQCQFSCAMLRNGTDRLDSRSSGHEAPTPKADAADRLNDGSRRHYGLGGLDFLRPFDIWLLFSPD